MKDVILIYDDTVEANSKIKTIIGQKSFGQIILKRQSMFSRIKQLVKGNCPGIKILNIKTLDDFEKVRDLPIDSIFFHLLSNAAVYSAEELAVFFKKLSYAKETTVIRNNKTTFGAAFCNRDKYLDFIEEYKNKRNLSFVKGDVVGLDLFIDLSNYNSLLSYISGGFDARFFNSLEGDKYTVTKRSADKKKMKMEYDYYWILPEHMRSFMVMPYDYKETADYASYTMERMPMADIAIRWTHGAVNVAEFERIMDRIFYFFNARDKKEIEKEQYLKLADGLYLDKVEQRIQKLKKLPQFKEIAMLIESGTDYQNIDQILDEYKALYEKLSANIKNRRKKYYSVIGHGDVFFANMLYSSELDLLRLIDPKGAVKESELWTNPYYDIAKLSHSVCGNYDFFNTGMYDVSLAKDMHFELNVHFNNAPFVEIFKEYLANNGLDYGEIRLYEASLFISMTPLHIDNPHKVFGFILNAIDILKEVKNYV